VGSQDFRLRPGATPRKFSRLGHQGLPQVSIRAGQRFARTFLSLKREISLLYRPERRPGGHGDHHGKPDGRYAKGRTPCHHKPTKKVHGRIRIRG
jgi:hypothetical protein